MSSPLVQFDGTVQGAVLSYSVPEPVAYNGQMVFKLYERRAAQPDPTDADSPITTWLFPPLNSAAVVMQNVTVDTIAHAMSNGFVDQTLFPNLGVLPGMLQYVTAGLGPAYYSCVKPQGTDASGYVTPAYWAPFTGVVCPSQNKQPVGNTGEFEEMFNRVQGNTPDQPNVVRFQGYRAPQAGDATVSDRLVALSPQEVFNALQGNKQLRIFVGSDNRYDYTWVTPDARVQIALAEQYRLSSYLGNYGAGRTIQTFSLLPGEKTTLTLKSYKKTVTEEKAASSILDSFTQESANDFEDSVSDESSNKSDQKDSQEWHVEAELSVNYGFVSADAKAGYSGGTTSAREQQSSNVVNATRKHAAKASSQRDINITQTTDTKTDEGEESSVTREIQNINVSATLNFVFRQLNQQYYSILHLVDVRLGYYDSAVGVSYFTVGEIDQLLDLAMGATPPTFGGSNPRVQPPQPPTDQATWKSTWAAYFGASATPPTFTLNNTSANYTAWSTAWNNVAPTQWAVARTTLKQRLLIELLTIPDYQDNVQQLVAQRTVSGTDYNGVAFSSTYWRTRTEMTSTYTDPTTGFAVPVPGIIVAVTSNVLRTDGIIVDAVLGLSPGLDAYSSGLQAQTVALQTAQNDLQNAQNNRVKLANAVLTAKDSTQAAIFGEVFPTAPVAVLAAQALPVVPALSTTK